MLEVYENSRRVVVDAYHSETRADAPHANIVVSDSDKTRQESITRTVTSRSARRRDPAFDLDQAGTLCVDLGEHHLNSRNKK